MVRVLGPDHPDTLTTRSNIAYWTKHLSASAQRPRAPSRQKIPGTPALFPCPDRNKTLFEYRVSTS